MAVGSGLGLRIATPLAPLRLDFGYPVTEGFGPPRLRVHFSIGQMF
jgi:outer membrane translocation and assembly module TamA